MKTNPLLPVLYNKDNSDRDMQQDKECDNRAPAEMVPSIIRRNPRNYYYFNIFLCLLAVFTILLTFFSESNRLFNPNKIISNIAGEFIGADLDDGNIYELFLSGSFGKGEKPDSGNSTTPDNPQKDDSQSEMSVNTGADTEPDSEEEPDYDLVFPEGDIPEGEYMIVEGDFSCDKTELSNGTEYSVDISGIIGSDNTNDPYKFKINPDMTIDPLVLIIHTHGTEAYSAEGSISYSDNVNIPRSNDTTKNVVAVGAEIARILNDKNIPTIHCTIMHDEKSYQNSYERAAQTIEKYLKEYPSIKYVLDIHRDSIIDDNNIKYRPLCYIDGIPTAQIMLVMGTDASTPKHTEWRTNLTLALKLTEMINNDTPGVMRRLSLRSSSYNQEYTAGSVLVEIGSCGNTLSEAMNAAVLFAEEFSTLINNGW